MNKDVIVNKIEVIERCLDRIREVHGGEDANLEDMTKQDSIILNFQRACEASIDLTMHLVGTRGAGVPQTSREAFEILFKEAIIDNTLASRMKAMVGFRNIAIHDYQEIDIDILQKIIAEHLQDFEQFTEAVLKRL
ncbi:hypothetical protein JNUCC1_02075 [Lentibacillus sp. JNUCC-1]|uniref:type VII toxin-antitoxin system HepT family RNase toxin n=1 Tax=Lentibacillus sp. JNUCC-1 TaxID=2654513 RepID=UPI0012E732C5|nr:DUF86 domain-containing protein [Lentibacillus sp. JNUCC-1]MUV38239.1 hypothetical protein [Lentibacillus sp. JNUCC-1]